MSRIVFQLWFLVWQFSKKNRRPISKFVAFQNICNRSYIFQHVRVKPSSEPMLTYCWLDTWEQISVKLKLKYSNDVKTVCMSWHHHRSIQTHDDFIKWKHFPRYWAFVRGIHRSPVNSPYKVQWGGALVFSLICAWINGRVIWDAIAPLITSL